MLSDSDAGQGSIQNTNSFINLGLADNQRGDDTQKVGLEMVDHQACCEGKARPAACGGTVESVESEIQRLWQNTKMNFCFAEGVTIIIAQQFPANAGNIT